MSSAQARAEGVDGRENGRDGGGELLGERRCRHGDALELGDDIANVAQRLIETAIEGSRRLLHVAQHEKELHGERNGDAGEEGREAESE